jgi:hypothetical protein
MVLSYWISWKSQEASLAATDCHTEVALSPGPSLSPGPEPNKVAQRSGHCVEGIGIGRAIDGAGDRCRDWATRLMDRLDALQAIVAPGSEHDSSWQGPAIGVPGLG